MININIIKKEFLMRVRHTPTTSYVCKVHANKWAACATSLLLQTPPTRVALEMPCHPLSIGVSHVHGWRGGWASVNCFLLIFLFSIFPLLNYKGIFNLYFVFNLILILLIFICFLLYFDWLFSSISPLII